jgi:hypothetical protein
MMKKLFLLGSFLWVTPAFSQTASLVQSGFAGDASGCNGSLSCTISTTVGVTKLSQPFGANHIITLFIDGEGTSNFPVPDTPSCNPACGTWTHISGGNVVSASGSSTTSGNYCAVQDLNSTGHHFFSDCWVVLTSTSGATGITVSFTDPGGGSDITNMDLFVAEYSCSSTCSPSVDTQAAFVFPGNGVAGGCTSCTGPSMALSGTNDLVVQTAVFEENCNTGCGVTNYTLRSWDTNSQNATADGLDRSSAAQAVWPQTPKGGGIFAAFTINLNSQSTGECTISPTSLPPYTTGESVSQQFTASNCNSSSFTISSGSLSGSGLSLSSSGMLSGTAEAGTFHFTVGYGTAADSISLTVNVAPTITTNSLSAGQVNVAYSQALSTSGGTGTIVCAVTSGSLPPGLTLTGCTIHGTPTAVNTYSFSVTPTDTNGVPGTARVLSIVINVANTSVPVILHTTFCGPGSSWPGTCNLSAPTSAGSRLVVVFSSYNSAGTTPAITSIIDGGGDKFSQLATARSINSNSASAWNDIWSASGVAAGQTALTVTPSTSQAGDVYVWEIQNAIYADGCAELSNQAAANQAVGALMTVAADTILLSYLHPAPGGNPTAVSSPFKIDTISDQMAYVHYTTSASGTYAPQWTQTAATFATAICGFSAAAGQLVPPASVSATAH